MGYIIDKYAWPVLRGRSLSDAFPSCASFPLTALGIATGLNGVGVSQTLTIYWHAPAPKYVPESIIPHD